MQTRKPQSTEMAPNQASTEAAIRRPCVVGHSSAARGAKETPSMEESTALPTSVNYPICISQTC